MHPAEQHPLALGIVKDGRRRAGIRVARVRVCVRYDNMSAAGVEELNAERTPHFLPFERLCRLSKIREDMRRKLRAAIAEKMRQAEMNLTARAEGSPADNHKLAQGAAVQDSP